MADLVERLINRFGQAAVNTAQGHEPSHTRRLHETLLRTFERRRRILGADQGVKLRHKTVSCSLAKVLHRHPSLEIAQTLQDAADYVGKVRHLASLLANYICTWKLDLGQPFPDATQRFFMECLTCYVQGAGAGYTNGAGPGAAQDLRNNSNLQALQAPGAPWRLHEVFLYVAKDMATVASTYKQVHFQRRRLAITHWALFQALRAHIMNDDDDPDTQVDMTVRPFTSDFHIMADLVERLINRFGQAAVNTAQGHEPSHTRQLHETLLRTFERRRRILGADQGVKLRHKTVSCSLAKVLHRHPSLEIARTLQDATDYVGKVRHLASLLANYICTWKLDLGQPFPDATQRFFMECLTCYVQGAGAGYTNGAGPGAAQLPPSTLQRFQDLRNNSNLQALQAPGAPWRLHEVFLYVAKDMATVASTYIQVHFQRRRLAITHWALFQALRAHIMNDDDDPDTQVDMTVRPFTRAVHDLAELVTIYAGNDLHGELQARLNQLGFRGAELDDDGDVQEGADYLKILDICETVRHLPDGDSDASKRRLLAQLQQLYVETDRTDYQDLMSELFEQFPDDAAARRENRDAVWGLLPVPPKLTAPLPRFKPQPAFIRIDRTGMGELFSGLAARMAGRGPWWYAEFMQPWAKAANSTTMRQRTNHYARSERGVMRAIERAGQPGYRILAPWLVDRTFMTDGHQLKLLLVSSHDLHQGPHGLTKLPRRGYQVGYINEELGDVLEGEVAEGPNGVFRLQRVHREIGAEPATVADGTPAAQERLHAQDHVVVTGVDPGQVLAFSAVTALGQRWRRDSAADFAANPLSEGFWSQMWPEHPSAPSACAQMSGDFMNKSNLPIFGQINLGEAANSENGHEF
ncbi:hypothetical protein JKP88DRAFT_251040 [Tribonema minus]|uniref:Uncharacterized protein n=1 Tax=Tribonema minus TaxID=303371 RepID=A0A836CQS9_9STRA|nr:hypothetical protein JKP88DRAFT_251040 [Tribonema minus]